MISKVLSHGSPIVQNPPELSSVELETVLFLCSTELTKDLWIQCHGNFRSLILVQLINIHGVQDGARDPGAPRSPHPLLPPHGAALPSC